MSEGERENDQPEKIVRNEVSGPVPGMVIQAGTIRGDIHAHEAPLPSAAAVAPLAAAANLPRRPVETLWGRDEELARLLTVLGEPEPGCLGAAIVGMPGVGKTELALHAVRSLHPTHQVVWWISAHNASAVTRGLAALAHHLAPDTRRWREPADGAEWAMDWLQSHDGWLLVLDNVEDQANVAGRLARIDRGPVLVTTRWNLQWSSCGLDVMALDVLPRSHSVRLLADATGLEVSEAAQRLAADLGDLPLSLRQASTYIREQEMSFDGYWELLGAMPAELLASPAWMDPHRDNTWRTLRLSIDTVAAVHPSAERLLKVVCCFAPDRVPRNMLTPEPREPVHHRSDLGLLRSYSLVTAGEGTVSVHRLLHQLVRLSLTPGAEEVSTAAGLLRRVLPDDPFSTVTDWPRWIELIPHAEALRNAVTSAGGQRAAIDLAHISHELGTFMLAQGWTADSHRLLAQVVEDRTRLLGAEDAATLASRHRLGEAQRTLGDLPGALETHTAVLQGRMRLMGPEHRDTLQVREALAITYKAMGRTNDAVAQHEAILRDRTAALGQRDPDVLWSMHNLALTYKQAGRLDEALALHRRVLAERTALLGPDHPDTLRCMHNIANILHDMGRYDEAISAQERSVADRIRVLGPTHRDTLRSQSNLADSYLAADRADDAADLHRRTLAQREDALGPDAPDTQWSRLRLEAATSRQTRPTE